MKTLKDHKRIFYFLVGLGFVLRIIGSFSYGTQDVEFWKAYATYTAQNGISSIYGESDEKVLQLYREGLSMAAITARVQTKFNFESHQYFKKDFIFTQPPLYFYTLFAMGKLHYFLTGGFENSRVFNFCVNLPAVLASFLIFWLILSFLSKTLDAQTAKRAALLYWLNPVVLLNSPIQGYLDPVVAFFALYAAVLAYERRLNLSFLFLTLGFLYKPQGILIAPVILVVGLKDFNWKQNIAAWSTMVATGMAVFSPYLIQSKMLSSVLAMNMNNTVSHDLSRQALNFWWVVQYGFRMLTQLKAEKVTIVQAMLGGGGWNYYWEVPSLFISKIVHFNIEWIGIVMVVGFFSSVLWILSQKLEKDRNSIFVAAALMAYGYFMLRVGVQVNHYFILIPFLALLSGLGTRELNYYLAVSFVFCIADFIFYGLGRDVESDYPLMLGNYYLGWTTVLLALINLSLFLHLAKRHFQPVNYSEMKKGRLA